MWATKNIELLQSTYRFVAVQLSCTAYLYQAIINE